MFLLQSFNFVNCLSSDSSTERIIHLKHLTCEQSFRFKVNNENQKFSLQIEIQVSAWNENKSDLSEGKEKSFRSRILFTSKKSFTSKEGATRAQITASTGEESNQQRYHH